MWLSLLCVLQGFILMDLKDTNALYDDEAMVYRLSDPGLASRAGSRQCGKDDSRPCADMERRAADGTRVLHDPDLRRLANVPAADILALAEMIYQLLVGCRPTCIDLARIEDYEDDIPGYNRETLAAMTQQQRCYVLTEALRDRAADMVYKGYWQVLLQADIAPVDADLADMLGQMMSPASERPSADKLLGHKAIKGEQDRVALLPAATVALHVVPDPRCCCCCCSRLAVIEACPGCMLPHSCTSSHDSLVGVMHTSTQMHASHSLLTSCCCCAVGLNRDGGWGD